MRDLRIERLETRTMLAHVGVDYTFGSNGVAAADASLLVSSLPDDKVLAVGATLAKRLNADGSIDPSFTDAGGAQAALGKMNWTPSSAVVSGGRLYVAGLVVPRDLSSGIPTNTVFIRAVNLVDGSKVDSFGDHGFATIVITSLIPGLPMGALNYPSIAVTPDGGLAIAVAQSPNGGNDGAVTLYRCDARGRLSHTFGGNGEVVVDQGDDARVGPTAVDPQGRILVLHEGETWLASRLTRYLADGSLDTSFGEGGAVNVSNLVIFASFAGMTVRDSDGTIILNVLSNGDFSQEASLAFILPDGTLTQQLSFGPTNYAGFGGPTLDGDGRIFEAVGGAIHRVTVKGQSDPFFGEGGQAKLPIGVEVGNLNIEDDGDILLGNEHGVMRFIEADRVALDTQSVLHIQGGDGDDNVVAWRDGDTVNVTLNDERFTFPADAVAFVQVDASEGNNRTDITLDLPITVFGGAGNDVVGITGIGGAVVDTKTGADYIETGDGDDRIVCSGPATIIAHGGDDDIASHAPAAYATEIDAGAGSDTISCGTGVCTVWCGDGNDTIFDSEETNNLSKLDRFYGESGNDTINGGDGDDFISGGPGFNDLHGNGGTNTIDGVTSIGRNLKLSLPGFLIDQGVLIYESVSFNTQVSLWSDDAAGNLVIWADGGINAVDITTVHAIRMTGDLARNLFKLNPGLNIPATLDGGDGRDTLIGGAAADEIYGAADNDVLRGNAGDDYLEGGAGHDQLFGGAGADRLFGLADNDLLFSNDGIRDTVRGGTGDDTAFVDDSDDVLAVETVA